MALHLQTNPFDLRRAAADGVVLGFPLLLVDAVRRTHPVGINQVLALPDDCSVIAPGLTDDDALIVRASAWIDLSEGPMLLALPDLGGRYWSVSLFDAWGQRIGRVDPRPHQRGLDMVLVGPGWRGEAPKDAVARRSPTNLVWAVVRIAARGAGDLETARGLVRKLALGPAQPAGGRLRPLSGQVDPPLQPALDALTTLSPHRLFHHLARLLARYPPGDDLDLGALAGIGVAPGKAFHLPDETALREALALGAADGFARVIHDHDPADGAVWRVVPSLSAPASALLASLGAAAPEDVQQWICDSDAEGRPLIGSEPYVIRFAPGATPPVDGFWTLGLAVRAASGALRAVTRHIDSREALAFEPDGGLVLRIDHQPPDPPGAWLPAPPGRLRLRLKLYWPKAAALAGGWRPPAPERIGGSRRSATVHPENRESPL
ncbi:MAG: DUF1254 domain-containing protein [Phenylobacterium sp.]|nr:DUF1254 domain-containing protein [Phenylobacterium sp.]